MKLHFVPLLAFLLSLSLLITGCSAPEKGLPPRTCETAEYDTPLYTVTLEESKSYLTPKTSPASQSESSPYYIGCKKPMFPRFSSVHEMRQGVISGTLREQEVQDICYYTYMMEGGKLWESGLITEEQFENYLSDYDSSQITFTEICNLNHLYECTTPDGFIVDYVRLFGKYYGFKIRSESSGICGTLVCGDPADYYNLPCESYKGFLSDESFSLSGQEYIADNFATVYYGDTSVGKEKYVCYEIFDRNRHITVQEIYYLKFTDDPEKVSPETPSIIQIWGVENSTQYYCEFVIDDSSNEHLSVEQILGFGLTPYTPPSTT